MHLTSMFYRFISSHLWKQCSKLFKSIRYQFSDIDLDIILATRLAITSIAYVIYSGSGIFRT
jgi:hypothetical protein